MPRSVPRARPFVDSPVVRRVAWHLKRMVGQLDRRFFMSLAQGIIGFVLAAAVLITLFEKSWTVESVFDSFNWGIATVLGQGDSSYVTSPAGRLIGWFLILFGVAMLGMITGALVAMVIDFLLKEGQGLGASGYKGHIVVCGWNIDGPRPRRRAPWRRVRGEGRRPGRRRQEPRGRWRLFRARRFDERGRPRSGPGSNMRRQHSSSRATPRMRPTCTRS